MPAQSHRNIADRLALPSCTLTACSSTFQQLPQFLAPKGSQGNTGVGRMVSTWIFGSSMMFQALGTFVQSLRHNIFDLTTQARACAHCELLHAAVRVSLIKVPVWNLLCMHCCTTQFSVLYTTLSSLVCHPSFWQANSSECFCHHFMNSDTATHSMCRAICVRRCGVEGDRESEQSCVCARE